MRPTSWHQQRTPARKALPLQQRRKKSTQRATSCHHAGIQRDEQPDFAAEVYLRSSDTELTWWRSIKINKRAELRFLATCLAKSTFHIGALCQESLQFRSSRFKRAH